MLHCTHWVQSRFLKLKSSVHRDSSIVYQLPLRGKKKKTRSQPLWLGTCPCGQGQRDEIQSVLASGAPQFLPCSKNALLSLKLRTQRKIHHYEAVCVSPVGPSGPLLLWGWVSLVMSLRAAFSACQVGWCRGPALHNIPKLFLSLL